VQPITVTCPSSATAQRTTAMGVRRLKAKIESDYRDYWAIFMSATLY
jgi:hypothetical protein